jgi:hypothetical protein
MEVTGLFMPSCCGERGEASPRAGDSTRSCWAFAGPVLEVLSASGLRAGVSERGRERDGVEVVLVYIGVERAFGGPAGDGDCACERGRTAGLYEG